ncbi:MAG: branched-chain amino acid ABC transporter permease, partial [Nitrososphaerales archaeon]
LIILFIIALIAPYVAPPFLTYILLTFFCYVPIVIGFNLLLGYTGLLSFGHGLFVAIGMYTSVYLMRNYGVTSIEIMLILAATLSALAGFGVGLLCIRYVRIFFAMLTLAFSMVFYSFLLKFYWLTGGDEGLGIYTRPALLGMKFDTLYIMDFLTKVYYYYVLAIMVILLIFMYRITTSHFGICLRAVKENPRKADESGLNVKKYRLYAFVISAIYTGIGGALLVQVTRHVVPAITYWTYSGEIVFMTLLGGFNYFTGPIIGAFVYIVLRDLIMSLTIYWRVILGVALLLIVIFVPGGLMGGAKSLSKLIIKKRESYEFS